MSVLWVALGAAVGAPARYLVDTAVRSWQVSVFPWGTCAVNVVGSLLLGLLVGLPAGPVLSTSVGTGFCGALTTYSTLSYQTLRLLREHAILLGCLNVVLNLGAGTGAAFAGVALGLAL